MKKITYAMAKQVCCSNLHDFMQTHGLTESSALTPEELFDLALSSSSYWRGQIAYHAPGLTLKQRASLAPHVDESMLLSLVVSRKHRFSVKQRLAMAALLPPIWLAWVATDAPDLTHDQRFELAMKSSARGRLRAARKLDWLTAEQRERLKSD